MPNNKFFVLEMEDIDIRLTDWYRKTLSELARRVVREREAVSLEGVNNYIVINQNEPFVGEIIDVLKSHGIILDKEDPNYGKY